MAYHSTSGMAENTADMHAKLKEFLVTTCGWTLHDDQMGLAQPYFVVYSSGESGTEDIYLQYLNDSNTNIIAVRATQYWNNTTHAPVKDAFATGTTGTAFYTKDTAQFLYWIYADLDHVFIVTKFVSTYYGHYSGIVRRFWSDRVAIVGADITAGSDVVVPVDDASIFAAGKSYIIKDNASIERALVAAVDTASSPNTITISSLSNSYAAGAKIGEDPQPLIVGKTQMPGTFQATSKWDGWVSYSGQSGSCYAPISTILNSADPDARYGLVTMFPWFVVMSGTGNEEPRGELIEVYAMGASAGDSEDVIDTGSGTYKMFNLASAGFCAVKE